MCARRGLYKRTRHVFLTALKEIDLDSNNHVSFLEFALYKYKFTVAQVSLPSSNADFVQLTSFFVQLPSYHWLDPLFSDAHSSSKRRIIRLNTCSRHWRRLLIYTKRRFASSKLAKPRWLSCKPWASRVVLKACAPRYHDQLRT